MEGNAQPELTPQQRHELYLQAHYSGIAASLKSGTMSVPEFIDTLKNERLGLEQFIEKDSKTGAFSRIHMEEEIRRETMVSERSGLPLGLAFMDLDHFKSVNDKYGHPVGDEVLKGFVKVVKSKLDKLGGSMGRWGGEEFVILFPNIGEEEILKIMTEVGQAVRLGTGFEGNIPEIQTVSCGVSLKKPGEKFEEWITRVDKLNYMAKNGEDGKNGRDRMVIEKNDGSMEVVKFNEV